MDAGAVVCALRAVTSPGRTLPLPGPPETSSEQVVAPARRSGTSHSCTPATRATASRHAARRRRDPRDQPGLVGQPFGPARTFRSLDPAAACQSRCDRPTPDVHRFDEGSRKYGGRPGDRSPALVEQASTTLFHSLVDSASYELRLTPDRADIEWIETGADGAPRQRDARQTSRGLSAAPKPYPRSTRPGTSLPSKLRFDHRRHERESSSPGRLPHLPLSEACRCVHACARAGGPIDHPGAQRRAPSDCTTPMHCAKALNHPPSPSRNARLRYPPPSVASSS